MKIKCTLEAARVVTASDDKGERKEAVLRPAPGQALADGLSVTVIVSSRDEEYALPAKGESVKLEMKWNEG